MIRLQRDAVRHRVVRPAEPDAEALRMAGERGRPFHNPVGLTTCGTRVVFSDPVGRMPASPTPADCPACWPQGEPR